MIMPSAANVKIEKNVVSSADNGLVDTSNSPLRQAITIIEHKIRNLEKRKAKLDTYRQKFGKELNADQKTAIAKYDEVSQTLDFARDLCKQFLGIALASEKDEKKKARKEAVARSQAEINKIREVLLIQDALSNIDDNVKQDFLNGTNGATQLSESDLKLLDDYYLAITPKHEAGDPTAFMPQVQAAAEHLLAVVDGKTKEIFGSTYGQVKEVIGKIHESGYLDQPLVDKMIEDPAIVSAVKSQEVPLPLDASATTVVASAATVVAAHHETVVAKMIESPPKALASMNEAVVRPPPAAMLSETMTPQQQNNGPAAPLAPPAMEPPVVPVIPQAPLPEQPVFYQQQPPPPPPPQTRPISEVIGSGSFFFLQESEIDTPAEQIPSQTFTNQTFVGGPPPPIPMPPHFSPYPPQQPPLQPPQPQQPSPPHVVVPSQPPVVVNHPMAAALATNPAINAVNAVVNNSMGATVQVQHSKNGIGDHLPDANNGNNEEVTRHRGNRHPQRSNITTHHQPFFANNNGYSNRPSRNRSGPRLNNRHNQ